MAAIAAASERKKVVRKRKSSETDKEAHRPGAVKKESEKDVPKSEVNTEAEVKEEKDEKPPLNV